MRKIFVLIGIFLLSNSIFAQEIPIFPGCEEYEEDNSKLSKCMSEKFHNLLADELEGFPDIAQKENIAEAYTRLRFTISKEGKIENIESFVGDNELLNEHSVIALENVSQRMIEKGEIIQPALIDNIPVNVSFQIPIRFVLYN